MATVTDPCDFGASLSPEEIRTRSQELAGRLLSLPREVRDEELRHMKALSPRLHAMVSDVIQEVRRHALGDS